MRRVSFLAALAVALALPATAQTSDRELTRLGDIGGAIRKCWRSPGGPDGSELTIIFSFKRNGEVLGKPRISHSKLVGDEGDQKAFVASVLQAISKCTPLHLSDALGGAVAGRPFAMRFINKQPPRDV
jgi:hypothetical protein